VGYERNQERDRSYDEARKSLHVGIPLRANA
jgi:hypothetical protein